MRPRPPSNVCDEHEALFAPAPELSEWVAATFIDRISDIANEDQDSAIRET